MTRVLLVDDDVPLGRALGINMKARGMEVEIATTGQAALDLVARFRPDVVILDLGLPDLDGIEVLQGIRGWNRVPVVVLSARASSEEKVTALDAGADDYVTKPFEMNELLARVRAALRRGETAIDRSSPQSITTASFEIDLAAGLVTRDGSQVRLTPTEYHLIEVLARNSAAASCHSSSCSRRSGDRATRRRPITCVSTWPNSGESLSPIPLTRSTSSPNQGSATD
jgi:two-component system KDP operon response regulator KdpE